MADNQEDLPMFSRYTDRARRVLAIAQDEARDLGHPYVGSSHLLLGLIGEGDGVAVQALKSFGNEAEMLADARRVAIRSDVGAPGNASGPLPFTPRLVAVLSLAAREAVMLGNNYIATEHLLLGLAAGSDPGASPLVAIGVNPDEARAKVLELLRGYEEEPRGQAATEPVASSGGDDRMSAALEEARARLDSASTYEDWHRVGDDLRCALAALAAVLKLGGEAQAKSWGAGRGLPFQAIAWNLDPAKVREAITRELTGEAPNDQRG